MTAAITPRISQENRTDLCEAIPLATPLHLFIDPSAACNQRCGFCFNRDKFKTHHEIMPLDLFEIIIRDLKQFPDKFKTIKLYAFGEPLMNRNLDKMIAGLKKANVTEQIETTTNGLWLKPETSDRLIAAGLDRIVISVNGLNQKQYEKTTGAKVDFEDYVKNIRYFYNHTGNCRVHIKSTMDSIGGDLDGFYKLFGDMCDEIFVENVVPLWNNVEIQNRPDTGFYGQEMKPVEVCPYIFYHMTIHASGDVSTCFIDWERRNLIGHIRDKTLMEIWNGEILNQYRNDHLMLNRQKYDICKQCAQLVYGQADNIDGCREKLLERLK